MEKKSETTRMGSMGLKLVGRLHWVLMWTYSSKLLANEALHGN